MRHVPLEKPGHMQELPKQTKGGHMKRFERISRSPEDAGLFMAQTVRCTGCPIQKSCETPGRTCAEMWTEYMKEEIEEGK